MLPISRYRSGIAGPDLRKRHPGLLPARRLVEHTKRRLWTTHYDYPRLRVL
jgi:hypothetical protein